MKNRKNPIPAQKREAADLLISAIAELHGVTIAELMGRCQRPRFVAARREAVQCVKRLELSYPQVGRIFGLDHKTVMYHCGALKRNYPGDFLADKSDMGAIS